MSYSLDPIADNCYPGTTVLINKQDIREARDLDETEAFLTLLNAAKLDIEPYKGSFDFDHYKALHKFLFDELYDWAGKVRTVNISKKGTQFCPCEQIEERAYLIFRRLKEMNYFKGLEKITFVSEVVDFYCATNELHPFREGNGRAQRAFITQLIRFAGHDFAFSGVNEDLLMIATIQSANGVADMLKEIFTEAID